MVEISTKRNNPLKKGLSFLRRTKVHYCPWMTPTGALQPIELQLNQAWRVLLNGSRYWLRSNSLRVKTWCTTIIRSGNKLLPTNLASVSRISGLRVNHISDATHSSSARWNGC